MTQPHICSSEQQKDLQHLPLKRKTICDDTNNEQQKVNMVESTATTTALDGTEHLDPIQSTQQEKSTTPNNIDTTLRSALYYSSNTLESQLPPIPQVVRRTARPCFLQGRTLPPQRSLTRHVTPESPTPEQSAPRWYKQSYMLFLALQQHPDHAMPRTELIKTALHLDRTTSNELNCPMAFGGKTPQNSASALLTNNHGRHFQSFRPSGSRTMHFRLAFEPADFDNAVATYQQWMKTLVTKDWPLCFGKPSQTNIPFENGSTLTTPGTSSPLSSPLSPPLSASLSNVTDIHHPAITYPSFTSSSLFITPSDSTPSSSSSPSLPLLTEFDEFIAIRQKERHQLKKLNKEKEIHMGKKGNGFKETWDQYHLSPITSTNTSFLGRKIDTEDKTNNNDNNTHDSICDSIPWKIQGDDDYHATSTIPTCWQDIVYVQHENSRNNYDGARVYAKRRLPINIPLGFYFGTPTVEDEFQLVKEERARALSFCLMYGRTVLDATDDQGNPFTDPLKEHDTMYCPFHFIRQANSPDKANMLLLKGKIYNQVICWTKRTIQQDEELLVWLKYE